MENLFANTGIGKHIIRTHHWGIVLPTLEKAEAFMKTLSSGRLQRPCKSL